jgi:hypothetical protein
MKAAGGLLAPLVADSVWPPSSAGNLYPTQISSIVACLSAPAQNQRHVARNAVRKADDLRREAELAGFQFDAPALEDVAWFAAQGLRPTRVGRVDGAASIRA